MRVPFGETVFHAASGGLWLSLPEALLILGEWVLLRPHILYNVEDVQRRRGRSLGYITVAALAWSSVPLCCYLLSG